MGYYAVRYWLTDLAVDDPTNSAIRQRLHAALLRAGIPLAVPASTVFVSRDDEEHKQLKSTREIEHRVALLSRLEFFGDFNAEELRHLAERLVHAPFAKGEVMTHQGRQAHWLYILAKGQGAVSLEKGSAGEKQVAILDPPNIFGEFAVMTGGLREATVLATEPSECYRLDKDAFIKIMTERPALAKAVSLVMAKRRTELLAVRDSLDAEQRRHTLIEEGSRLLGEVERFFGLHT
jgi:CRP-like cAMP-binding protein